MHEPAAKDIVHSSFLTGFPVLPDTLNLKKLSRRSLEWAGPVWVATLLRFSHQIQYLFFAPPLGYQESWYIDGAIVTETSAYHGILEQLYKLGRN